MSQFNKIYEDPDVFVYVPEIWRSTGGWSISRGSTLGQSSSTMNIYRYTKGYIKSSSYTTVTSTNRNAYPDDGLSGNYWYEYQGQS